MDLDFLCLIFLPWEVEGLSVFFTDVQASWKKICEPLTQKDPISQCDVCPISIPDTEDSIIFETKFLHSCNDAVLQDGVLRVKIPIYILNSLVEGDQTHGHGLLPN